jgi:putative transposase
MQSGGSSRKKSWLTDSQTIVVLKQAEAGIPVLDLCREHGISTVTFYKWRAKFGGMDVSLMAKMKELEDENRRLKKLCMDSQMRALIVEEALAKK